MKSLVKNPLLIVLLIIAFSFFSGCACNQSKKEGLLKGILFGTVIGAGGAVLEEEFSDDLDPDDDLEIAMAIGALAGGIIGYFMDTCEPEPVAVAQAPVDTDSDGDGVVDRLDQCPDTPEGIKVDYKGCPMDSDGDGVYDSMDRCPDTPAGVKVDINGCPLDTDSDGVYDYLDKCPDTRRGARVDSNGCSLDKDNDGVPNRIDECPKTPRNATVNGVGCWVLDSVLFDINKSTIKPAFYPELDHVVTILNKTPKLNVEIQGHTCSLGSEAYNQTLSEKRATAIMNYLISKGIDKSRLSAKGYGESKPVQSNDTEDGRKANRRVQLDPVW
ncbi:OmpA family protein [Thermodesulfobacteriota bacterium]